MKDIHFPQKKKQKIILISYANDAYRAAQELQTKTAKTAGFTDVIEYGPKDIEESFKEANAEIFKYKRGNGLWLWKPYSIKKTLDNMKDGEILFYCDSGACFFRNVDGILSKLQEQDVWVSVLPLKEKQFTKQKTFDILDCNTEEYKESAQISGTFCAFKKSELSTRFVDEWLQYCCDIKALAPPEDKTQEARYFYDHREDQSILSLLVKKYKLKAWSDPSQYGRLPEKYIRNGCEMVYYGYHVGQEDYPICLIHHRTKDGNRKVLLNQLLCAVLPRKIGLMFIDGKTKQGGVSDSLLIRLSIAEGRPCYA